MSCQLWNDIPLFVTKMAKNIIYELESTHKSREKDKTSSYMYQKNWLCMQETYNINQSRSIYKQKIIKLSIKMRWRRSEARDTLRVDPWYK